MIVIFGGTGEIGYALVEKYSEMNKQVCIISRCEHKQRQMAMEFPKLKFILGDIRDHHWKYMVNPSLVYNLAGMNDPVFANGNPEFCYDVNVNGVINTMNWALESHCRYIYTSKILSPTSILGASKTMAEKLVLFKGGAVFRLGDFMDGVEAASYIMNNLSKRGLYTNNIREVPNE